MSVLGPDRIYEKSPTNVSPEEVSTDQLVRQVRTALTSLYDLSYLQTHGTFLRPALDMRPIRSRNGHQQGNWEALRRTTELTGGSVSLPTSPSKKTG